MNREAVLFRFYGVTAHFRDPRYNTAYLGKSQELPLRTLRCPPPCTIHGLICAAAGRWVEPESLELGWRMDFANVDTDFQTCQIPQRAPNGPNKGNQTGTKETPVVREILSFPVLTLLAVAGIEANWFRCPVNPLSLGRSEDLIVRTERLPALIASREQGEIARQCLPFGHAYGTVFAAPLYFVEERQPIGMAVKTDVFTEQSVTAPSLVLSVLEQKTYYLWRFNHAVSEE